jgi:hypothetical protein
MRHPAGSSVQAHMPQACEAKRAGTKKEKKSAGEAK